MNKSSNWSFLDAESTNEKILSFLDADTGAMILSKLSAFYYPYGTDVLSSLEKSLLNEVKQIDRIFMKSIYVGGVLWCYVTYKVRGFKESFYNFCYTTRKNSCFLCKSSFDDVSMNTVLLKEVPMLLGTFNFNELLSDEKVICVGSQSVYVRPRDGLRLNEHSNSNSLFFTDENSYCVLTSAYGEEENLLDSAMMALNKLNDDKFQFDLVKHLQNEDGYGDYYDFYNVTAGTSIIGSITAGVVPMGDNACITLLYYNNKSYFQDVSALFDLRVERAVSESA